MDRRGPVSEESDSGVWAREGDTDRDLNTNSWLSSLRVFPLSIPYARQLTQKKATMKITD